jgi:hypothetical protein
MDAERVTRKNRSQVSGSVSANGTSAVKPSVPALPALLTMMSTLARPPIAVRTAFRSVTSNTAASALHRRTHTGR